MGIVSTVIAGALFSAGALFWSAEQEPIAEPVTGNVTSTTEPTEARRPMQRFGFGAGLFGTTEQSTRAADRTEQPTLSVDRPADRSLRNRTPEEKKSEKLLLDHEAEAAEIGEQIGRFVTDYWVDRVNSYREFINSRLDAGDLAELNRLRVRWDLLEEEGSLIDIRLATKMKISADGGGMQQSFGLDGMGPHGMTVTSSVTSSPEVDVEELGQDIDVDVDSEETEDIDTREEVRIIRIETEVDEEVASDTEEIRDVDNRRKIMIIRDGDREESIEEEAIDFGGFDAAGIGQMLKMAIAFDRSQKATILQQTWEIAARNRADLDELRSLVMADARTFGQELESRLRAYAEQENPELAAKLSETMGEGAMTDLIFEEILGPLYDVLAEPMLMLYNGSDITQVLSTGITEPVAGITLDSRGVLAQSYPNPATSHATIGFDLNEPSSATVLRLYDVNGNEVARHDLGGRNAGAHSYDIDLSSVPTGTYLYHLSVMTPEGSRVWSRSLEVVR